MSSEVKVEAPHRITAVIDKSEIPSGDGVDGDGVRPSLTHQEDGCNERQSNQSQGFQPLVLPLQTCQPSVDGSKCRSIHVRLRVKNGLPIIALPRKGSKHPFPLKEGWVGAAATTTAEAVAVG